MRLFTTVCTHFYRVQQDGCGEAWMLLSVLGTMVLQTADHVIHGSVPTGLLVVIVVHSL